MTKSKTIPMRDALLMANDALSAEKRVSAERLALSEERKAELMALREKFFQQEERIKKARAELDDLKTRLVESQAENERMRGYIKRVQEDDVVREELIRTGDPEGEVRLSPKRQVTSFDRSPDQEYGMLRPAGQLRGMSIEAGEQRRPRRHWITYGP